MCSDAKNITSTRHVILQRKTERTYTANRDSIWSPTRIFTSVDNSIQTILGASGPLTYQGTPEYSEIKTQPRQIGVIEPCNGHAERERTDAQRDYIRLKRHGLVPAIRKKKGHYRQEPLNGKSKFVLHKHKPADETTQKHSEKKKNKDSKPSIFTRSGKQRTLDHHDHSRETESIHHHWRDYVGAWSHYSFRQTLSHTSNNCWSCPGNSTNSLLEYVSRITQKP